MAWAFFFPSSFSVFFPDGDDIGWRDAIRSYYENEMTDAEKEEMDVSDRLTFFAFSQKFTKNLGPLKDVECPKEYKLRRTPKKLGDMIKIRERLPLVTEAFKDVVEALEPNVHQFWPVTLHLPRNQVWPVQYYGMRIGQFFDSFLPEQSEEGSYMNRTNGYSSRNTRKAAKGLAFSKEMIAGKHLWREVKISSPKVLMSDELQSAAAEKGLHLPKHYPVREV